MHQDHQDDKFRDIRGVSMIETGRELFHVSRSQDWYIGKKVSIGEQDNNFWSYSRNYSPQISVNHIQYDLFEFFSKFSGYNLDVTKENVVWIFDEFKHNIKECSLYIREQIFEKVRNEIDPDLPSRQKCLWLTDMDHLDYWKGCINCRGGSIVKLKLDGNAFMADDSWLQASTLSSSEYERRAKLYWTGQVGEQAHLEFLFTGEAVVTGIQRIV